MIASIAAIPSTVTWTVCSSYSGDLECALLVGMRARSRAALATLNLRRAAMFHPGGKPHFVV